MAKLWIVLCILFCVNSSALATPLVKCPAPPGVRTINHPDTRIREIFARVIAVSQLPDTFALCQHKHHEPLVARIYTNPQKPVVVVALPPYVSQFSNDALEGLLAHQLGHVPGWKIPLIGLPGEKRADDLARQWVGTQKVFAFLAAMKRSLTHYPVFLQKVGRNEIAERTSALIDPIVVASSRS